jgi:radical SAM/Cys-rich protein
VNDFTQAVYEVDTAAAHAERLDALMVNVGLRCNMACSHCHQSSSPARTEMMSRADMESVARLVASVRPGLVDITGGAPELHPDLPFLLESLAATGTQVRIRTNLTALLDPAADGLIDILVENRVGILASLPGTCAEDVCSPRGDVFDRCVEALLMLSAAGYGRDAGLRLDIALNPAGPALERSCELEKPFRDAIERKLGIPFDDLLVITNMPIGRFRDQLRREGSFGEYRQALRDAFNPDTVRELACRTSLSIAWDGTFSDCDFNLGAGLRVADGVPSHISEFDAVALASRPIRFAEHCFGCTALSGSG